MLPLVTLCYLLLPFVYPVLPCGIPCYPFLPCVTPCYPLLPCVTPCFSLIPCVTPIYPVLPIVTLSYPLLPCVTPLHASCSYWSDTLNAIVECGSAFIEDISKAGMQMLVNYPLLLTYMVVILM